MSYWTQNIGSSNMPNFREYRCDKRTDIQTLPTPIKDGKNGDRCSVGSECLCLEDSSVWILGSDKWNEVGV